MTWDYYLLFIDNPKRILLSSASNTPGRYKMNPMRRCKALPESVWTLAHRIVAGVDISKSYLNYMGSHGIPLDDAFLDMLFHTYYQNALSFIRCYREDAGVNDLVYARYQLELTARYFRGFLTGNLVV